MPEKKKYKVTLREDEKELLQEIMNKGNHDAQKRQRGVQCRESDKWKNMETGLHVFPTDRRSDDRRPINARGSGTLKCDDEIRPHGVGPIKAIV